MQAAAARRGKSSELYDLFGEAPSPDEPMPGSEDIESMLGANELQQEGGAVLLRGDDDNTEFVTSSSLAHLDEVGCVLSRKEAERLFGLKKFKKATGDDDGESMLIPPSSVSINIGKDHPIAISPRKDALHLRVPSKREHDEEGPQGSTQRGDNDEDSGVEMTIGWKELSRMAKRGRQGAYQCFYTDRRPRKISVFSESTQRPLSLMPSEDFAMPQDEGQSTPPTLVIGGFTMHRIKNANPETDTRAKIASFSKGSVRGDALDICTGLGYTAIEMSRRPHVDTVLTLELDPSVLDVCRCNPWSQDLFKSEKITSRVGNAAEVVKTLDSERFSLICHDPPARALNFAGELYSLEFYSELYRILKSGGTLFHYVGNPDSKESGVLFAGIMKRLQEAGFKNIKKAVKAFGITADK